MSKRTDRVNSKKYAALLAAAATVGLLGVSSSALAANIQWNVPPATTNGDYGLGTNWVGNNVPGSADQADVSNGGTANITTSETFNTTEIWAGDAQVAGAGSSNLGGTILQTGGTLNTSAWLVVGRFNVSGTYDINNGTINQGSAGEIQLFGSTTLGQAIFNIHGTAQVTAGGVIEVGTNNTSNAVMNLADTATLNVTKQLFIGNCSAAAATNATTNGTFNMTGGTLSDTATLNLVVGRQGGTGVWNLSGGTVTKNDTGSDFIIGLNNGVGNFLTTGTLTMSGASTSLTTSNQIWIGENNNATGTTNGVLNVSSGTLTANNWIAIGRDGGNGTVNLSGTGIITETASVSGANVTFAGKTNVMNQTGGTFNNTASATYLGEGASSTWNISGGLANLGQVQLNRNSGTTGTINLNGGIFSAKQIIQNTTGATTTGTINFNGGTLQANTGASTAFLTGISAANVLTGGAVIDTNSNNITIGQSLLHSGTVDGGLNKIGSGILTLTGANTYTGATTITAGTLSAGSNGALGNNTVVNISGVNGATLDISPAAATAVQIGSITGGGFVTLGANRLTIGADNTNALPYAGVISGTGGITKIGTGTQIFSGASNYSGNTAVNAGVLNITGSLTGTASVNAGGTLTGLGDNTATGIIGGAVTVNGGGTIATSGLSSQAFVVNGLNLGNAAGSYGSSNYATVSFNATGTSVTPIDVGVAGNANGVLTLNSGGAYIPVSGITASGTYTLMNFGSQIGTGFSLDPTNPNVTSLLVGRTSYSLADNTNSLVLTVLGQPTPGIAYFDGAVSNVWNDVSNPTLVNWSSNLAGTADAGNIPAATTNVFLTASNQTGAVSTRLGASTTINSLNVNNSAASNTITADGSTLTINALADGNGNTAGNGISVVAGAGPVTINVPIILGGTGVSQTWTNSSSNALTLTGSVKGTAGNQTLTLSNTSTGGMALSGAISNSASGATALTINNTGAGVTVLTGANTYTGNTTLVAGTLQFGDGTSGHDAVNSNSNINNSGSIIFNGAANESYAGVISGSGSLTQSGNTALTLRSANTYTGTTTISTGTLQLGDGLGHDGTLASSNIVNNGTLAFNQTGSDAYAGVISGSGVVTMSGAGTQTLTGANNYSGTTTINSGTLRLGDGTAGHDGSVASTSIVDNGTLSFSRSGTSTYSGVISGTGVVAVNSGTQILPSAETYTGATNINGGTLQLGTGPTGSSTGSLSTSSAITDNGTLAIDRSNAVAQGTDFTAAPITGTGGIHLINAATLTLNAGNTYTGNTVVSNGAVVVSSTAGIGVGSAAGSAGHLFVGDTAGQSASITFANGSSGSFWGSSPSVTLGSTGTASGTMTINGGTVYSDGEFWVSNGAGATGELDVNSGSLTVNSWLAIGRTSGTAVVNLSGTGSITKNASTTSNVTFAGVSSVLNQTGGTFTAAGTQVYIGEVGGSSGTWNFSAGTANINDARIGISGTGVINQSGTSSYTADYTTIAPGSGGTGTWNLNSGTATLNNPATALYVGESGTGTLNITGPGAMTVIGSVSVGTNASANATLNLNAGGSLSTFAVTRGNAATVAFNGNGGTLQANADSPAFLQGFTTADAHLNGTGLTIDSNGHAIGSNSSFNGSGGLTKIGAGTLTLSGAQAYVGNTTISAGTVQLSHQVYTNNVHGAVVAAYYPFNPASQSTSDQGIQYADTSGNGNTLTDVFGSSTVSASGPNANSGSITFPVNNKTTGFDYLTSSDGTTPANFPIGNSSYTLAAWVNLDGTNTSSNGIVGWGNYGNGRQVNALKTVGSTAIANYWWAADAQQNTPNLNSNWHYVAATYNATTDIRSLYVDGTLLGTDSPGVNGSTSANFTVGATNINLGQEYFSGSMSDLLIASTPLSSADLAVAASSGVQFGTFVSDGQLSPTSVVAIASGASLDLGGTAQQTISGLSDSAGGGGTVTNSVASPSLLTLTPTGTKSFSGAIQDGAGSVAVTITGPGTQVLGGGNTYSGNTKVTGGTLEVGPAGSLPTTTTLTVDATSNPAAAKIDVRSAPGLQTVTVAAVNLVAGATLSVASNANPGSAANHPNRMLLVTGALNNAGTLDLAGNDLLVHNADAPTAATTLSNLTTQLSNGFTGNHTGGYWNGTGIKSSAAAADTSFLTTLGVATGLTSFDGTTIAPTDVAVKYTYYGDADLNGTVNGADYQQIDMGFGTGAHGWANGDFNYDGVINGSDFALIDNTFNQISARGASPLALDAGPANLIASPSAISAVPEPTSLTLIAIGTAGLLGRRRRKMSR